MTEQEPISYEALGHTSVVHFGEFPTLPADSPRRSLLVEDARAASTVRERVRSWLAGEFATTASVTVEGGEVLKSLTGWERILAACDAAQLDRDSVIVALGGGSVADSGGFAAATWQRGIDWIGIPTTLLGMVDAHIGGKVGINYRGMKNQVGAFHPPRSVIVDLSALAGLPDEELRSGWGEVVKSAVIGAPDLFAELEIRTAPGKPSLEVVHRCVGVKVAAVAADPLDRGVRRTLNLGHTLGHALEEFHGPGALSHGEGVAAGLVFAAHVASDLGLAAPAVHRRLTVLLDRWGYRLDWNRESPERLLSLMRRDKKNVGGVLRLALPVEIGRVRVVEVAEDVLLERLRRGIER